MQPISVGESIFLGIVQGLTEFLPVSSSGHLVIFQHLLGLRGDFLFFDVVVHAGTLLAVVFVYWRDLGRIFSEFFTALAGWFRGRSLRDTWHGSPFFRLGIFLAAGTVPAAVAGLLLKAVLEKAFRSLSATGVTLILTGTVLFLTRLKKNAGEKNIQDLTLRDSLVVGIFQSLALFPGLSRSGMTIAGSLFVGLNRDLAARFSFLLMVPAVLGASVLELQDVLGEPVPPEPIPLVVGGLVSLIMGYLALKFLIGVVHRGRLYNFAYYCWTVGAVVLVYSLLSR